MIYMYTPLETTLFRVLPPVSLLHYAQWLNIIGHSLLKIASGFAAPLAAGMIVYQPTNTKVGERTQQGILAYKINSK